MPAIWTANEKFRTNDASCSKGWQKNLNGWHKVLELLKKYFPTDDASPFKLLQKNLKRIMPGIRTAEEKGSYWMTRYKQLNS